MSQPIVVDTNIIVSTLISANHRNLEEFRDSNLTFLVPAFLLVELIEHAPRIQQKTKLPKDELLELISFILNRAEFVTEEQVSIASWSEAHRLCSAIDRDDIAFVALAIERSARIWTNDRRLRLRLEKNGFVDFHELKRAIEIGDQ